MTETELKEFQDAMTRVREKNNTPEKAWEVIEETLRKSGIEIVKKHSEVGSWNEIRMAQDTNIDDLPIEVSFPRSSMLRYMNGE